MKEIYGNSEYLSKIDSLIINISKAYKNNVVFGQEILLSTTTETDQQTYETTNNIIGSIAANDKDKKLAKKIQTWHSELRKINANDSKADLYTKLSIADSIMQLQPI